jgi:hypothetical protein
MHKEHGLRPRQKDQCDALPCRRLGEAFYAMCHFPTLPLRAALSQFLRYTFQCISYHFNFALKYTSSANILGLCDAASLHAIFSKYQPQVVDQCAEQRTVVFCSGQRGMLQCFHTICRLQSMLCRCSTIGGGYLQGILVSLIVQPHTVIREILL